MSVFAKKLKMR